MKKEWKGFHSVLRHDFQDFLAFKRALGRKYWTEEAALRQLDRFLVDRRILRVRAIDDEALGTFLASRRRKAARSFNHLVGIVERFFDWMVRHDRLSRSPLVTRHRRRGTALRPCILDAAVVRRLLDLASELPDRAKKPRRGRTFRLIFGLLYALGLRVGEVTRLLWADVDFKRRALLVRDTKFGKTRLVPFGPRVEAALRAHQKAELGRTGRPDDEAPVFSLVGGRAANPNTISQTFHTLVPQIMVSVPVGVRRPHLHDLRHSFAVGTLLRWYRAGLDANDRLLHLATFLGHVDATSTSVYLTMTTELLDQANRRFARLVEPSLREVLA